MELTHSQPSRAVSRSRSIGISRVLGVEPDRFDDEVKFVGAIDLARHTYATLGRMSRALEKLWSR